MIALSEETWDIIRKVHREVNSLPYKTDMALYGKPEFWTYITNPSEGGDCEDFVLTKRKRLIEAGLDPVFLIPAVGKTSKGEGHCVLLIETVVGCYVLDNNCPTVVPWNSPLCSIAHYVSRWSDNGKWLTMIDHRK